MDLRSPSLSSVFLPEVSREKSRRRKYAGTSAMIIFSVRCTEAPVGPLRPFSDLVCDLTAAGRLDGTPPQVGRGATQAQEHAVFVRAAREIRPALTPST